MILIYRINDLPEFKIMSRLKTLRVMHEYSSVGLQSG